MLGRYLVYVLSFLPRLCYVWYGLNGGPGLILFTVVHADGRLGGGLVKLFTVTDYYRPGFVLPWDCWSATRRWSDGVGLGYHGTWLLAGLGYPLMG